MAAAHKVEDKTLPLGDADLKKTSQPLAEKDRKEADLKVKTGEAEQI